MLRDNTKILRTLKSNGVKHIVFWAFAKKNLKLYSADLRGAEKILRSGGTLEEPVAKYKLLGNG